MSVANPVGTTRSGDAPKLMLMTETCSGVRQGIEEESRSDSLAESFDQLLLVHGRSAFDTHLCGDAPQVLE